MDVFFCGGQLSCLSGARPGLEVPCVGWPMCGHLGSGHRVAATHSFPMCPLTVEVSKHIVPDLQDTEKLEEANQRKLCTVGPAGPGLFPSGLGLVPSRYQLCRSPVLAVARCLAEGLLCIVETLLHAFETAV